MQNSAEMLLAIVHHVRETGHNEYHAKMFPGDVMDNHLQLVKLSDQGFLTNLVNVYSKNGEFLFCGTHDEVMARKEFWLGEGHKFIYVFHVTEATLKIVQICS